MSSSKAKLSLDEEITLYGVVVRKMPNGQYLKALELLKELPQNLVTELNDQNIKLSELLETKNVADLVIKLIEVLPNFTLKFISELLNIDYDIVLNKLTPSETLEIVEKFIELNKLNDFFIKMKSVASKFLKIEKTGFNEQL